jgi:hypothetical protein
MSWDVDLHPKMVEVTVEACPFDRLRKSHASEGFTTRFWCFPAQLLLACTSPLG